MQATSHCSNNSGAISLLWPLEFCCPKIPFYWEPIFQLVFLDRVFFFFFLFYYFKQFLNKILYFKSVMSSEICLALVCVLLGSNDKVLILLS